MSTSTSAKAMTEPEPILRKKSMSRRIAQLIWDDHAWLILFLGVVAAWSLGYFAAGYWPITWANGNQIPRGVAAIFHTLGIVFVVVVAGVALAGLILLTKATKRLARDIIKLVVED